MKGRKKEERNERERKRKKPASITAIYHSFVQKAPKV
jgi:hypothetical protein